MVDVLAKDGDRIGGVKKKLSAGDYIGVASSLHSSKLPQREIRLSWWHTELIWVSDGVPQGD